MKITGLIVWFEQSRYLPVVGVRVLIHCVGGGEERVGIGTHDGEKWWEIDTQGNGARELTDGLVRSWATFPEPPKAPTARRG